jgi:hypothetical protein
MEMLFDISKPASKGEEVSIPPLLWKRSIWRLAGLMSILTHLRDSQEAPNMIRPVHDPHRQLQVRTM